MEKISTIVLFLVVSICFGQNKSQDVHLQYGTDKQQNLDLYLPATIDAKTPVIILLHGGAWMMGGNEYTAKHAGDLRDRGFVVANVDYRYVSKDVYFIDLLTDIESAMDYLYQNADKYHYAKAGYHLVGISAGAHLALLYGYTTVKKVKSITALCAPSRLDSEEALRFIEKNGLLHNIEWLANASYPGKGKPGKAFTTISPYSQIENIPTLLIHGTKDTLVPYQQSVDLLALLQRKKVDSRLITMEGKRHDVGMNQQDSEKIVLDAIVDWINTHQ
ncbi:alpha/beta hydrolase [Flavobacterium pallidum]|uniref:BD-FAE-like domain-containing protein n=1 Tax=Flavobacterium pallidum TaxID=2172098 RepID=A0A2S1SG66_9FLAO|nr:alpha/beta hydrolase [Flavobacterium pallidum]AWI25390.1 hypothetical protein HYN49_05470 [Flavobacterium pallidum]